jgi:hypothetical protein
MSDIIRIKVYVSTGFAGCNHEDIYEVGREWWESLTPEQQEKELDQMAVDYLNNCVECNAWVMEDDEK